MRRILLESVALVAIVTISASTFVGTAAANVPTIVTLVNISVDVEACISITEFEVWADVTISNDKPSSTHYVDWIEADFNGLVQEFSLTPQTFSPFTSRIYLGRVLIQIAQVMPPQLKVRAHCTVDGWSGWTIPIPVPEFPVATIAVFTALATLLFTLRRKPT